MKVPTIADGRAALWAFRALRSGRAQLREGAVRDVVLPAPPAVSPRALRAVRIVLRSRDPSCLERALVLQRWLCAHGVAKDVVLGTQGSAGSEFRAHAWLDGEPQPAGDHYVEILRLAPSSTFGPQSGPVGSVPSRGSQ